ncbi:MAG: peptidylprolyl isomerase [Bacteroidetes bacterium]|nr:MAG: peptidylprolyl isomerase [Bacteroidota bacterium]RLD78766.1 MAG: peptidylprolyl isomerase [Bacteroidota bacterium]
MKARTLLITLISLVLFLTVRAQDEKVIDQIVAVIGQNIILESDIENQYYQYRMQSGIIGGGSSVRCQMLESLLFQKLLLNQAEIDSIVISDTEIQQTMDQRLRYFIAQLGSRERFEEYYGKSIEEFKEEFSSDIENQLKVEKTQGSIVENVTVTPAEVRSFFKDIPTDSIPLVNSMVEIGELIRMPPVTLEQKLMIKDRLRGLRERVMAGETFSTLAILYSEDPGSAKKGGELGFYGRGELYKEFEAIAFKLGDDEVSEIVETQAGFHIIQLIERKGEYVNVRHILLKTKVSPLDLAMAKAYLDTVAGLINTDSLTFDEAVLQYSDGENKNNGGLLINPMTGTTGFEVSDLDPQVSFVIDKLKVGEISKPAMMETEDGKQAYRLLYLKKRTLPHRANMREDYDKIQSWALEQKKAEAFQEWIAKKAAKTYIRINDKFRQCDFEFGWFESQE